MRILIFLVSGWVWGQDILDAAHFPDPQFLAALQGQYPGGLTSAEAASLGTLNVASQNIADVTGIEHFTGLEFLVIRYNQIGVLPDLGLFPNLIGFYCNSNLLTALPGLETLANLSYLNCSNNPLSTLPDLTGLPLEYLNASSCPIRELPWLGNIPTLRELRLMDMGLSGLPDLTALTGLQQVYLTRNRIPSLNFAETADIRNLYLADNLLAELPDLGFYPNLVNVHVYNNLIIDFPVFPNNPALETVYAGGNLLTTDDCPNILAAIAMPGVSVQYTGQGNFKNHFAEFPNWPTSQSVLYWVDLLYWRPYIYTLDCEN
ncbi:MAG: leucine-rich repeat domain-containing protein [Acidobacteria bacterium]|nr:leucine-rich repeat domain-containing protein [Acidobacteriota bacterium]MCB9396245.1 leucine-rich repeat domain-containing protein [Acidobacteriota bacterium]